MDPAGALKPVLMPVGALIVFAATVWTALRAAFPKCPPRVRAEAAPERDLLLAAACLLSGALLAAVGLMLQAK